MDRITTCPCRHPDIEKAYYLSMRLGLIHHQCRHKDVALTSLSGGMTRWTNQGSLPLEE